jgi:hypothetical protein
MLRDCQLDEAAVWSGSGSAAADAGRCQLVECRLGRVALQGALRAKDCELRAGGRLHVLSTGSREAKSRAVVVVSRLSIGAGSEIHVDDGALLELRDVKVGGRAAGVQRR